jgi:hypothetical protein
MTNRSIDDCTDTVNARRTHAFARRIVGLLHLA